MKKHDREEKIVERLEADGSITVTQLSEQMGVSAVTIRTDLKNLESRGVLFRTHGGAVVSDVVSEKVRHAPAPAVTTASSEKTAIARCAQEHIRPGGWIFLGSGSTCLALARQLSSCMVNVVTNSIAAAQILSQSSQTQVVMPGGTVFPSAYPFLYGDMLHTALESMVLDQAFVGVSGIDLNFGYSLSNVVECSIFSKLRQISKELIVLSDASKFGKTSFMGAGPLSSANCIITAGEVSDVHRGWCSQAGVSLLCAPMR